jgi:hypothetical protein
MINEFFYITGRGGSIEDGLGCLLASRAQNVTGVSLSREFLAKPFESQLAAIQSKFPRIERDGVPVIATGYGAYLLLNSLIGFPALKTGVLLISPSLGRIAATRLFFEPAFPSRIPEALVDGTLCKPEVLDIFCGSLDYQVDLASLEAFSKAISCDRFSVLNGQAHRIEKAIVSQIVDGFLGYAVTTQGDGSLNV